MEKIGRNHEKISAVLDLKLFRRKRHWYSGWPHVYTKFNIRRISVDFPCNRNDSRTTSKRAIEKISVVKANFTRPNKLYRRFGLYCGDDGNKEEDDDGYTVGEDFENTKDFRMPTKIKELQILTVLNEWISTYVAIHLSTIIDECKKWALGGLCTWSQGCKCCAAISGDFRLLANCASNRRQHLKLKWPTLVW